MPGDIGTEGIKARGEEVVETAVGEAERVGRKEVKIGADREEDFVGE